jgi:hypothetical protein
MDTAQLTVIVEWDNVRRSEIGRATRMLQSLVGQICQLHTTVPGGGERESLFARSASQVEILILYNDEAIDGREVESIVTGLLQRDSPEFELRIVPAPGLNYYALKNLGARLAKGNLVVFLDSDVIPQRDWLANLIGPFAKPEIQVLGGDAYVDPDGLAGKTFALFWFFDGQSGIPKLYKKQHFFANNVAFRKELLLRYPFPELQEGVNRGSCTELARILHANGIEIYRHSGARVSHPAPNGIRHIVTRAIAEGRDRVFLLHPDPKEASRQQSLQRLGSHLKALGTIIRERATVGLPAWQVPLALGLCATYQLLQFYGEVRTRSNPDLMRRRFQI